MELLGRHLPVELSVEAASQAGENSRNDERAPSVASNRDAHELGSGLIIPNRAQGFPERRAVDPPEEPYRPEEGHQGHVVEARDEALWSRVVSPGGGRPRRGHSVGYPPWHARSAHRGQAA